MLRSIIPTVLALAFLSTPPAHAARKVVKAGESSFRCAGAICVDAASGKVLAEENADVKNPPASVTKLMTLLVVLEEVDAGKIKLTDKVTADKDAWGMGGTQVALAIGETHTVEELLYALMVQSANDAAMALAKHVGGSRDAFVSKMNARAAALGMANTRFTSPHGLPPSRKSGDDPDLTSARDLAKLSVELIRHTETLRYTSAKTYRFRPETGDPKADAPGTYNHLKNHNRLLGDFPGCDGMKTGWTNAGASIVTTASRGGKRVIAVVLGGVVPGADPKTPDPKLSQRRRDDKASKLMEEGLAALGVAGASPTPYVATAAAKTAPAAMPVSGASVPQATPAAGEAPKAKAPEKLKDGTLKLNW